MPPALTGALGGKVLPFLDAPGLVPPLRPFLPGPKDCLRPQSLSAARPGGATIPCSLPVLGGPAGVHTAGAPPDSQVQAGMV